MVILNIAPQCNQEPPGEGNNPNPSRSTVPSTEAFVEPATEPTLRLKAEPAPGNLDRQRANLFIAGLTDALFARTAAAVVGRRGQPGPCPYLSTIAKVAPG